MRHVLTLSAAVLAASLSLASAQTTVKAQSIVVNPVQTALIPALHLSAALTALIRAGGTITLTDAQGRTVATVNQDGSLKLADRMTLASATTASVKQGNTTTSYPLASPVGNGPLLVTTKNAEGRAQVIPLVATVSRTTEQQDDSKKKDDGKKKDGQQDGQGQDGQGQSGEHGNSGQHGNGHPGQPGHGNGHR